MEKLIKEAVLNLCPVKLRDQQRLEKLGYSEEYPQHHTGQRFGDAVPRSGNASGCGRPDWKTDPVFATTQARLTHMDDIWDAIEDIAKQKNVI